MFSCSQRPGTPLSLTTKCKLFVAELVYGPETFLRFCLPAFHACLLQSLFWSLAQRIVQRQRSLWQFWVPTLQMSQAKVLWQFIPCSTSSKNCVEAVARVDFFFSHQYKTTQSYLFFGDCGVMLFAFLTLWCYFLVCLDSLSS